VTWVASTRGAHWRSWTCARIAVTNLVADVETVRRDLDLERVHILAHSAAANLALLYAVAHLPG